ncbi:MAG: hypothetical protein AAF519_06605 [Bacteroidota bacterium]
MLNKKFLALKTRSYLKKNSTKRANLAYDTAKTAGILFTVEDLHKHEQIKKFIKNLERDGKKVSVLSYLPKGMQNFEFRFDFFSIGEFNFWGKFESQVIKDFVNQSFDYLFYIDIEGNALIHNILAMSKAKCRIGGYNEENARFCEMMVEGKDKTVDSLLVEMYKYTQLLA